MLTRMSRVKEKINCKKKDMGPTAMENERVSKRGQQREGVVSEEEYSGEK